MKIIDLLNKIANGEEVPHFKVSEIEYFLNRRGNLLEQEEGKPSCDTQWFIDKEWLNTEVEILEEEKKIPEKLKEFGLIKYNLDYIDYKNIEILKEWLNQDFQTIYDTLDSIIKNQNQLIDYLNSKGE